MPLSDMRLKNIRLVALDLDQTTLRQDKSLSEENREAILAVMETGVSVVVASGRSYDSLPENVLRIPGIEIAITGNGAAVCEASGGRRLQAFTLKPEAVSAILDLVPEELALETFVAGLAYADAAFVADPRAYGLPEAGVTYIQKTRRPVKDIRGFIREHMSELDALDILQDRKTVTSGLREEILEKVGGIYTVSAIPGVIEIADERAGKKSALQWLAERMGISPGEIAAFGDAENDLDMIAYAGLGVAVANASEEVRAMADLVTASNEENGVAKVLRRIAEARNKEEKNL